MPILNLVVSRAKTSEPHGVGTWSTSTSTGCSEGGIRTVPDALFTYRTTITHPFRTTSRVIVYCSTPLGLSTALSVHDRNGLVWLPITAQSRLLGAEQPELLPVLVCHTACLRPKPASTSIRCRITGPFIWRGKCIRRIVCQLWLRCVPRTAWREWTDGHRTERSQDRMAGGFWHRRI